jgi:hypothetical protein
LGDSPNENTHAGKSVHDFLAVFSLKTQVDYDIIIKVMLGEIALILRKRGLS